MCIYIDSIFLHTKRSLNKMTYRVTKVMNNISIAGLTGRAGLLGSYFINKQ